MVSSSAATVSQYLAELEPSRSKQVSQLRDMVLSALPQGFEEAMEWGMICYQVPLAVSGPTYNKKPLAAVAIASQKNYISIYLLGPYASEELTEEFHRRWLASGKKLNMGKSCVRFKSLDDADLETIKWACSLLTPIEFTKMYLTARGNR
ncbi:MAG: hypothetical protein RLZ65_881 [Actinomycetota bacterium]